MCPPQHPKHRESEHGQAVLLVVVAMGIVLLGALGFAIDGSQLFAQRRMAQAAADAAAEAGMISMLDGTDASGAAQHYAQLNGFGGSSDTVTVGFPSSAPGVSNGVSFMQVTIQRTVPTTLMKLLGASASMISATATAAIVNTQPTAPQIVVTGSGAGTFSVASGASLTITGGANRVIQINSNDPNASSSSGTVDLSGAGVNGNGADFAVWGGPASAPLNVITGTGRYVQPGSPITPAGVTFPSAPPASPNPIPVPAGVPPCPGSLGPGASCLVYAPGLYTSDINLAVGQVAVFEPGIYYLPTANFISANAHIVTASSPADPATNAGMLLVANSVQLSGNSSLSLRGSIITGTFSVLSGNASIVFPSPSQIPSYTVAYTIKQVALVN